MDTSTFTIWLKLSQPETLEEVSSLDLIPWTLKKSGILFLLNSKLQREWGNPKFRNGDRTCNSDIDLLSRKGWKPQFIQKFSEIGATASSKLLTNTKQKMQKTRLYVGIFIKRAGQSHFALASFKIELVFRAYAQLFSDKTLSSLTSCFPEQLNLERLLEAEISWITYPSV